MSFSSPQCGINFFATKVPYFNVWRPFATKWHSCNKTATINKKCMIHREPETEREREIQSETQRDTQRESERATEILSGSLWLSLTLSGSLWLSLSLSGLASARGLYFARHLFNLSLSSLLLSSSASLSSSPSSESHNYHQVRSRWCAMIDSPMAERKRDYWGTIFNVVMGDDNSGEWSAWILSWQGVEWQAPITYRPKLLTSIINTPKTELQSLKFPFWDRVASGYKGTWWIWESSHAFISCLPTQRWESWERNLTPPEKVHFEKPSFSANYFNAT